MAKRKYENEAIDVAFKTVEIAGKHGLTPNVVIPLLIQRGIAAYERDGLIREPLPEDCDVPFEVLHDATEVSTN